MPMAPQMLPYRDGLNFDRLARQPIQQWTNLT